MVEVLVNKARSFIYSTAPPPALAAATTAAIRVCQSADGDARRQRLGDLAAALALGLGAPVPLAAILPYHVGSEGAALDLALGLRSRGFYVPAIRYPTVGRGQARLRFTLSADHTQEQIDSLTRAVQDYHAMHGAE